MKKTTNIFLILLSFIFITVSCSEPKSYIEIEIIGTTDIHGYALDPKEEAIGYASIANYVEYLKEQGNNVILLDSGDYIQGAPIANFNKGLDVIQVMNAVGYDAATIGNHEFDFGDKNLLNLIEQASFPIVSANIRYKEQKPSFPEYASITLNDAKIAIIGITTPETYWKTATYNIENWSFIPPADAIKSLVIKLKKSHDLIVVLAHLGSEGKTTSTQLAQEIPEIDIILDGHDHKETPEGRFIGNTFIMNSGPYAKGLAQVSVKIENGSMLEVKGKIISVQDEVLSAGYILRPRAQEVQTLLKNLTENIQTTFNQVVFELPIFLDGERENVRRKETNLGNLIADSFRAQTNTEVAFINGGSIRTSLKPGLITFKDILSVIPFENTIVSINATGDQIKAALEHSLSTYPEANGGFLHVSGLTYTYDTSAPRYSRIVDVLINNEPIDPQKQYSIALSKFTATGGDNFIMLKQPVTTEFTSESDILVQYIQKHQEEAFEYINTQRSFDVHS